MGSIEAAPGRTAILLVTPSSSRSTTEKGRGEVRREAAHDKLPPLARVTALPCLRVDGRDLRWIEFRRNRKDDSVRLGYGFELEFTEPAAGPVSLGYGCHFGLGLFMPANGVELR